MQTFRNAWWLKLKFPETYLQVVPKAGDFHGHAHLMDGVVQIPSNFGHIIEPCLLRMGVVGFTKKMDMKQTSTRYRWLMIILAAGLQWLRKTFTEEELKQPHEILNLCKHNLAVYNFVGCMYYFLVPVWLYKKSMQVHDVEALNFMWRFSLRVYGNTNKTNYKSGCVQNTKVLYDSEPNARAIMNEHRTYTETGKPCTGAAIDYMNEQVRQPQWCLLL